MKNLAPHIPFCFLIFINLNLSGQTIERSILGFKWHLLSNDSVYYFDGFESEKGLKGEISFSDLEIIYFKKLGIIDSLKADSNKSFKRIELVEGRREHSSSITLSIEFDSLDLLVNHYLKYKLLLENNLKGYDYNSSYSKNDKEEVVGFGSFFEKYSENIDENITLQIMFDELPLKSELNEAWLKNQSPSLQVIRYKAR